MTLGEGIATGAAEGAQEVGEIGKGILEAGASVIAPIAIAGIVVIGLSKMLSGFQNE